MNHPPIRRRAGVAQRRHALAHAALWALAAFATEAGAFNIETDSPDLKRRWETTVGDSLGFRTMAPSAVLTLVPTQGPEAMNFNDGDLNFSKCSRPIANRFDLFTEADVNYRNFGARLSGAAWYDQA